jgi:SAM-dependent methyltransferase
MFLCTQTTFALKYFANQSEKQFKNGKVFEYKNVVHWDNKKTGLVINRKYATARISALIRVLDRCLHKSKVSLLEVGCEAGQNLLEINKKYPHSLLAGIDISAPAINALHNANINGWVIDIRKPNAFARFKKNSFDYILLSHVLEHILEVNIQATMKTHKRIFRDLYRIAEKGIFVLASNITTKNLDKHLTFIGHQRIAINAIDLNCIYYQEKDNIKIFTNKPDNTLILFIEKDQH